MKKPDKAKVNRKDYDELRELIEQPAMKAAGTISVILYEYLPMPEYGGPCYELIYMANSTAEQFNSVWEAADRDTASLKPQVDHWMAEAKACIGILV